MIPTNMATTTASADQGRRRFGLCLISGSAGGNALRGWGFLRRLIAARGVPPLLAMDSTRAASRGQPVLASRAHCRPWPEVSQSWFVLRPLIPQPDQPPEQFPTLGMRPSAGGSIERLLAGTGRSQGTLPSRQESQPTLGYRWRASSQQNRDHREAADPVIQPVRCGQLESPDLKK